jgi:hypothetical protein
MMSQVKAGPGPVQDDRSTKDNTYHCPHGCTWIWWAGLTGMGEWMEVNTGMILEKGKVKRTCECEPPIDDRDGYCHYCHEPLVWEDDGEGGGSYAYCECGCKVVMPYKANKDNGTVPA